MTARSPQDQPNARTIFNRHHLVVIDFIEISRTHTGEQVNVGIENPILDSPFYRGQ